MEVTNSGVSGRLHSWEQSPSWSGTCRSCAGSHVSKWASRPPRPSGYMSRDRDRYRCPNPTHNRAQCGRTQIKHLQSSPHLRGRTDECDRIGTRSRLAPLEGEGGRAVLMGGRACLAAGREQGGLSCRSTVSVSPGARDVMQMRILGAVQSGRRHPPCFGDTSCPRRDWVGRRVRDCRRAWRRGLPS
jgi:hypothetical protein